VVEGWLGIDSIETSVSYFSLTTLCDALDHQCRPPSLSGNGTGTVCV